MHGEDDGDIGEERKRQPLQDAGVDAVAQQNFCADAQCPETDGVETSGAAQEQSQRSPHRAEVGAEVDHVGDEKQGDDRPHQRGVILAPQVLRDAAPGDAADPAADLLDDDHEGEAEQHGPGEAVAELSSDLAVGRDPARVVVGRTGDQARAQPPDQAWGPGCGEFSGDARDSPEHEVDRRLSRALPRQPP